MLSWVYSRSKAGGEEKSGAHPKAIEDALFLNSNVMQNIFLSPSHAKTLEYQNESQFLNSSKGPIHWAEFERRLYFKSEIHRGLKMKQLEVDVSPPAIVRKPYLTLTLAAFDLWVTCKIIFGVVWIMV